MPVLCEMSVPCPLCSQGLTMSMFLWHKKSFRLKIMGRNELRGLPVHITESDSIEYDKRKIAQNCTVKSRTLSRPQKRVDYSLLCFIQILLGDFGRKAYVVFIGGGGGY
jgi:hypothetical protein